ncbi:solute carrier family protein (macronuclear) [Tetrahymena thermophila SB210]|uniref:Solute carrier family protein n=1 Tax=Tetrahymena thermophila (strain SB210) TaxID=312017 RepID=I7M462_TETTS|nr:solute carrier family protein [Tetrahymena thermophila SB210]EAS04974.1 solute carrier family protein [Tetrahymena thermophila SB210]|eukprot:XP_001025219.1 solute carrier family protein [Tetrahymena thermophila SB210]
MEAVQLQKPQKKVKKINWNNFLVGTCLSFATQPFEVLRTSSIINKTNNHGTNFQDLGKQIIQIWKSEGYKGFYRGGVLAILKSTIGCGIFFTGLENIRYIFNAQNAKNPYLQQFLNFLSASSAKLVTSMILSPINVMKTRFEVVGQNEYKSILSTVAKITKEEGFIGFYRGILPTLMRDIPWSGLQFAIYSSMIQSYDYVFQQRAQDNTSYVFFVGAVSSGLSLLMVYPFDNIRVRYQGKKLETRSMGTLMKQVYTEQGFFGFYKGYLPRLLKKCTSGALTWTLYEQLNKRRVDSLKLH